MNNDFWVTRENHWQIASIVTQKSLFTVTHALFFMHFHVSRGGRVFPQLSRIGVELIRRTGCPAVVCMVQGRLVAAEYHSRHSDWCPRLTYHHRCRRRMLADMPPNWDHQHWSHPILDNECRISLYNCNGRARVFRRVVERIKDYFIQETDGIRRHDDQSGTDWLFVVVISWTYIYIID